MSEASPQIRRGENGKWRGQVVRWSGKKSSEGNERARKMVSVCLHRKLTKAWSSD